MLQWLRTIFSAGSVAEPAGPSEVIRRFAPGDAPIAGCASWVSDEVHVSCLDATTVHLFEVELPDAQQCRLTYRFRISSERLARSVYAEMWVRLPGRGEFFSRGLNQKISGTNDFLSIEVPFLLRAGQVADLAKLNLVFEGPGVVKLKDVELLCSRLGSLGQVASPFAPRK